MNTITLTDNFELRVPDDVRDAMHLKAGTQFRLIPYDGRLEFVPIRKPSELRGFARGMDLDIERDDQDRL